MSTIHAGELPGQRAAADTRPHPLEPLSEDEVRATAIAVRGGPEFGEQSVFVSISLREPAQAGAGGLRPDRPAARPGERRCAL